MYFFIIFKDKKNIGTVHTAKKTFIFRTGVTLLDIQNNY
tara:strand:+ start:1916 stop:2032 length:117 start_codon:yes stop_codon:yes gene_type:complete